MFGSVVAVFINMVSKEAGIIIFTTYLFYFCLQRGQWIKDALSVPWGMCPMDGSGGEDGEEDTGFAALHTARLHDSAQSGQERCHQHRREL